MADRAKWKSSYSGSGGVQWKWSKECNGNEGPWSWPLWILTSLGGSVLKAFLCVPSDFDALNSTTRD